MKEKKCTKCGLKKPLDAFSKKTAAKDGLQSRCKECAAKSNRAWYKANSARQCANSARWREANREQDRANSARWQKANPEKARASSTRWAQANPEKCCARSARFRKAHREELREKGRAYDAKHREERCEKARAYGIKHPEKCREKVRRRRARKQAVSEHFTPEMARFAKAFWNHQCAFCSATTRLELDHWHPLSRGHALTMSNAVLLCKSCNDRKGHKLLKDLNNRVQVAAVEQRLIEQAQFWPVWESIVACRADDDLSLE